MATSNHTIYTNKKEKLTCPKCKKHIEKESFVVFENENSKGICFKCSPFATYLFLPPGDAAMTRRSKKHSEYCGVVFERNQRRRRLERRGQYIEAFALSKARSECDLDKNKRALTNQKASVVREKQDKIYIEEFAKVIRVHYPNCPPNREVEIASHACEKYSGRVGRSASAKEFDKQKVDLAVEAHIRHKETNYDTQFNKGKKKREIRSGVKFDIVRVMNSWR